MKRTRMMGLCLLAVGAIFALTAGSASAFENLPHYGECNKTEAGSTGVKYSNSGCTKVSATGKDFWHPISTAITFTSKIETGTGEPVLEGASGTKISCEKQEEKKGEYGPGNEVKNVVGEFGPGCKFGVLKCASEGQKEGFINTEVLTGEPGIVEKQTKEEKNIDGNDLRSQAEPGGPNGFLAQFNCAGAPVKVKGGVIIKAQADSTGGTTGELTNKMANKIEVEFVVEPKGKQIPTKWTPNGAGFSNKKHELITENLETSIEGASYEESGQTLTTVQATNGTKPKLELRQCEKTIECAN